ncbi:MAG: sodium:solute symporter [Saprospiraceae bacterium]|nr:MAG: sodium:solute symporter [Saprospiraceae bacterium]
MLDAIQLQWLIILVSGLAFFWIAPVSRTVAEFFSALSAKGKQPGVFMLTSSLVISWIFAKSITNAANLGLQFGFVGGVAYAVYYLSFVVAGIVIYQMRVKGGFQSIHHFLQRRFGRSAVVIFSLLVGFRLFNEVWSNTMVIGSYFGDAGSSSYYASILVFTGLTLAYTLKGGLRSSLLTDAIQMILFGLLLFVLLGFILPKGGGVIKFVHSGSWEMAGGLNLLFAALIQVFSYPFHDSVMTDRGFISNPKTTLISFLWAALIGFFCITAFSFIGIYAQFAGLQGQAAVEVSKLLGLAGMLAMNFIMVTSAASTLDSAFSSFSKLIVIDLGNKKHQTVKRGRLMMVLLTILGTLPIFAGPEILSATTISGTMVIGLAPVFLFWKLKPPKLSFYLSVGSGVLIGILLATGTFPERLIYFDGKYADLLASNIWGTVLCFSLFFGPILLMRNGKTESD